MKKLIVAIVTSIIIFSNIQSMAAVVAVPDGAPTINSGEPTTNTVNESVSYNKGPSYFGCITNYWDTVYNTTHYNSNGGFMWMNGNVSLTSLPYGMINEGTIYTACCYNGRIYYSTGVDGSDIDVPTKIYSCDMNGQNNILLADNAVAYNDAIIVDNVLYYEEFTSYSWHRTQGYSGGISKIDLNNLSWQRLVIGDVDLKYCDGEYVYYTNNYTNETNINAAIDINGQNVVQIIPNADELGDNFIQNDKVYYVNGSILYAKELNQWKQQKVANVHYGAEICNISSNYIYYVVTGGTYSRRPTATVYKVEI